MAFYKKEPTAFSKGTKGQGPKSSKGDEGQTPKTGKAWNKKDNNDTPEQMCKSCGGKGCSCDKKENDWENRA